ncbi:MAG TPA: helix-turn-helix transcriptional regulator [Chitinophagaceae bacterium]|nr:helix-turn-helix transcriptional regulator [Chitinophagaceae bacterium]
MNTDTSHSVHQGRNIKRFREMFGMKQDALAFERGGKPGIKKKVSVLESKETVEPDILEQVAKILKVTPEAIRNCYEEMAINIIANTITNHDQGAVINYNPTFNPHGKDCAAL